MLNVARPHTRLLATLCFVISLSITKGHALAQELTFGAPPPGTEITVKTGDDTLKRTITSVDGLHVHYKGDRSSRTRDTEFYFYGHVYSNIGSSGRELSFSKDEIDKLWPLASGKSATFTVDAGRFAWKTTISVVGVEEIETALGKRKVYVVNFDEAGVLNNTYAGDGVNYLDFELRIPIKGKSRITGGRDAGQTSDFEVIEIKRP